MYRNTLIFISFIGMLLFLLMGMKQITASQRVEMQYHAKALDRANTLIDYMKENEFGARAGAYDSAQMMQIPICSPCEAKEQAKIDLMNWNLANQMKLPEGSGSVAYKGDHYLISVQWKSEHENKHCVRKGFNCLNIRYDFE